MSEELDVMEPVSQVALRYRVAADNLRRRVQQGDVRGEIRGRFYFVSPASVTAWLAAQRAGRVK